MGFRESPKSGSDHNLVFMGTAAFAVPALRRLAGSGFRICGVITQPDRPAGRGREVQVTPVGRAAMDLGLRLERPASLRTDESRRLFDELAPELLVVVAYGKIIPPWLIALPRYGVLNIHGSLLPKYRGAAPIQWAVANGETETGVCAMQIDEGLDTGPVYLCESTSIGADETAQELSVRLAALGADLAVRAADGVMTGALTAVPQDDSRASLAPILRKSDGVIDWNAPAESIHNRVRAFNPWPGATATFRGATCKILKSKVASSVAEGGAPGTVVEAKKALAVVCGDGRTLEILVIQPENRGPVSGPEFANGRRIQCGERFESIEHCGERFESIEGRHE
ncbi:MAG TPA: methionyl-tRNA formyltransferase [Terriglobia bacterium]|nr:methionyl-tRNA formyltransferase [Terriglobia bacterium]